MRKLMREFKEKFKKYHPVITVVAEICSIIGFIITVLVVL
ncbi:Uncharacterised protein [Streptococcus pneumoniae]|nr:Uncharacterised protein [Streptococcus pneumoniae]